MASKKPFSISSLLSSGSSRLGALQAAADRAKTVLSQVEAVLPPELSGTVHAASFEQDGTLTLIVESGAYASRLRYALPDVLPHVLDSSGNPAGRGRVQVRPRPKTRD